MTGSDTCDVVVVFHSDSAELGRTLATIRADQSTRIVVVDVSDDADATQAGADIYVRHPNRGYASACHAGFAHTSSPVVVFSNSDVLYDAGALRELVRVSAEHEGVAYPVQRAGPGEPIHIDSLLPVPSLRASLARWLWVGRGGAERARRGLLDDLGEAERAFGNRYVGSGACFAITRAAWTASGGLPLSIFLHHEDIALGVRFQRLGIPALLCPGAAVVHVGGHRARSKPSDLRLAARSEREAWRLLDRRWIPLLWLIQIGGRILRSPGAPMDMVTRPRRRGGSTSPARTVILAFDARLALRDGKAMSLVPMNAELLEALAPFDVLTCFRPLRAGGTHCIAFPNASIACEVDWDGVPGFSAVLRCSSAIWRAKGDAVVAVGPGVLPTIALLTAWMRQVPARRRIYLVNTPAAGSISAGEYVSSRWVRKLVALSARILDAISVACAGTKLAVSRSTVNRGGRWLITPELPGWDLEHTERAGARADLLFVGRLEFEKGADIALEAFALLLPRRRDLRLTIVGDGRARSRLERQAAGICPAGSVDFVGRERRAAALRRMAAAQVVVVPSRSEAFGLVAFEAAFLGAWVLTSAAGGLLEAVGPFPNASRLEEMGPATWSKAIDERLNVPPPRHAFATVDSVREAMGWTSVAIAITHSMA